MKNDVISSMMILLALSCVVLAKEEEEKAPAFSSTLTLPAGKVVFVGFDRGTPDMIRLAGDIPQEEINKRYDNGIDVVDSLTAKSELKMNISAWWPPELGAEKSWGRFKVATEWDHGRTEHLADGSRSTTIDRGGVSTGVGWRLEGFREYAEENDAEGKPRWKWRQTEKYHRMSLKKQDTKVEGLEYYRVPCAMTADATKGLVIFIADDLQALSTRIRVSGKRTRFNWNAESFTPRGK